MTAVELTPDVTIQRLIDSSHEQKQEPPRPHLGCSEVGHHCARWLWLKFRWAVIEQFDGRLLRLFRRGHDEEVTIKQDLEAIGVRFVSEQERVDFGAHLSGSSDGRIVGVPGAEKTEHLLEDKTHSLKSFNELEKKGVQEAKPQHWAQMQVYMHGLKLKRALYFAVCKDDDRIYTERVYYDPKAAGQYIERGRWIATAEQAPPKPYGPDWYQCKWCAASELCHEEKPTREVNCRTCAHSTPKEDSTWHCAKWDSLIPYDAEDGGPQLQGCPAHVFHPDLVPWELESIGENWHVAYRTPQGTFINGDPQELEGALSSLDILEKMK